MMSSTTFSSYPGRMYSISVFVKSNFLSVLQWLWSPSCPQGGILFSCADTFLQQILKPTHTDTHTHTHRPSIRRIQSLKRKQTCTGSGIWTSVHVELCSHILCFYQLGCGPTQAFSEHREHCPRTALYPLAMSEWKKNPTWKKYLHIQHLFLPCVRQTWRGAIVVMSQYA